jgi:hypothetical protein
MTHWRRKPDAIEMTAIYIRMIPHFLVVALTIANLILVCKFLTGEN